MARKAHNKTLDFQDSLRKAKLNSEKEALKKEQEKEEKAKKEQELKQSLKEAKERSYRGLAYDYIDGKTDDIASNLKLINDYKDNLKKLKNSNLNLRIIDQGYTNQSYFRPCTSLLETSRETSNFHKSIDYLSRKLEDIQKP